MKLYVISFFVLFAVGNVKGHSYHLGSCPDVAPQRDFNMKSMLGIWYAIEKTSTASSCIVYNFTKTDEPNEYELIQTSQHFALKLAPISHNYRYTGRLTVPDLSVPAKMSIKFALNPGHSIYTIVSTDYKNYALLYTCQKLTFANRQSATILSREKSLDKDTILQLRNHLTKNEIDPYDLSIISQSNCPKPDSTSNVINIDDETLSAKTAGNAVRGAGQVLGTGVEYAVEGAHKVYDKLAGQSHKKIEEVDTIR